MSAQTCRKRLTKARLAQNAECSRGETRLPITTALALHEDVLDVVLDHGVRFVRLPQKAARPHDSLRVLRSRSCARLWVRGLSNPRSRQCSWMEAWSGTTV